MRYYCAWPYYLPIPACYVFSGPRRYTDMIEDFEATIIASDPGRSMCYSQTQSDPEGRKVTSTIAVRRGPFFSTHHAVE